MNASFYFRIDNHQVGVSIKFIFLCPKYEFCILIKIRMCFKYQTRSKDISSFTTFAFFGNISELQNHNLQEFWLWHCLLLQLVETCFGMVSFILLNQSETYAEWLVSSETNPNWLITFVLQNLFAQSEAKDCRLVTIFFNFGSSDLNYVIKWHMICENSVFLSKQCLIRILLKRLIHWSFSTWTFLTKKWSLIVAFRRQCQNYNGFSIQGWKLKGSICFCK